MSEELDLDRDEEIVEVKFPDCPVMRVPRWILNKAMEQVARENLARTIKAEIGLVRYFEEQKKLDQ